AVCLLSVRNPDEALWKPLKEFVSQGGHLLVIPGREVSVEGYTKGNELLPGSILKMVDTETSATRVPARWEPLKGRHPLLAKFVTWNEREDIRFLRFPRSAKRYWAVEPRAPQNVIVAYGVDEKHPALLERLNDRHQGWGRVLMLTTPLEYRPASQGEPWNDYATNAVQDGFYLVLA